MMAERVLEDVGRSPCLGIRLFLSACFTPNCAGAQHRICTTTWLVGVLNTIMRNRVMCVSTMHDAIYGVFSRRGWRRWRSVRLIQLVCARLCVEKVGIEPDDR